MVLLSWNCFSYIYFEIAISKAVFKVRFKVVTLKKLSPVVEKLQKGNTKDKVIMDIKIS